MAWNPKFNDGILGTLLRQQQHGAARRLRPPLRPPERRQPGAGAAAAAGPVAGGLLHWRQPDGQCLGNNGVDPSTAFRIGPDGNERSAAHRFPDAERSPTFRAWAATPALADVTGLDPQYRPERTDNLTVSLQRQVNKTMSMEVGYIGRIIRNEMLPINLDSVPYMTTLGGQTFANAFAQIYFAGRRPAARFAARRSRSLKPRSAAPAAPTAPATPVAPPRWPPRTPRRSRTRRSPICGPRSTRRRVGRSAAAW